MWGPACRMEQLDFHEPELVGLLRAQTREQAMGWGWADAQYTPKTSTEWWPIGGPDWPPGAPVEHEATLPARGWNLSLVPVSRSPSPAMMEETSLSGTGSSYEHRCIEGD